MRLLTSKASRWLLTGVMVLVVGGLSAGIVLSNDSLRKRARDFWDTALGWADLKGSSGVSDTIYWCPMDPQIKRSRPGTCPICSMALVELEDRQRDQSKSALVLTAQQVQQAGVVTEPVFRRPLFREIDTTGRLDYDERRYAGISSTVKGKSRIEKLHVNYTGEYVEKGALLAEVYSPELIVDQQAYLFELERRLPGAKPDGDNATGLGRGRVDFLDATRQKLLYQGLTPAQIDRLATTREVLDRIPIHAPVNGTVIKRHVQEGQYVNEGDWLFHLADLRQLWFFADVFEHELALVRLHQPVVITVRSFPGETFYGTVAFIDPVVQPHTRTVRVRIDVDNSEARLKPGMYARAQLRAELFETVAVPENAVIWSGRRSVVLVKRGEGTFEPRQVRIGQKWLYATPDKKRDRHGLQFGADQQRFHQVLAGLEHGEEVVTSGAFLLNAESQFQEVLTKMLPAESTAPDLEHVLGDSAAQQLREVLDAYHGLSDSLAGDDLTLVPAQAGTLARAAEKLHGESGGTKQSGLAAAAIEVSAAARQLADGSPRSLEDARKGYAEISRALISLMDRHGGSALFGRELFLMECPMADKFGYKRWVGPSEEIHNPYMGQKMLQCGSVLTTFQP